MKKRYKNLTALALALASVLCLFGCGGPGRTPSGGPSEKLKIVATNFPPFDFARQIAGDLADVSMLLSPGQESHTFEPTPQDIIKIQQADLFIMGGGESDQWAKRLIASSQLDERKILSMMDCVTALPEEITEGMQNHEEHAEEDHSEFYEYDEHVWTSPLNAIEICKKIAEKLIDADREHEQVYTENLNRCLAELDELDKCFADVVENGARKTLVFGDRFPFRYFADRYGLSYYAAFPGCSGETEPDAATMKFLIDKVKQENIPVVLHAELSNRKIADAVCEAAGAEARLFHSCHSVTKDEFDRGETYLSLMKNNVAVLKEALS